MNPPSFKEQIIEVESPLSTPLGPEELGVVGLEEFLAITAPEADYKPRDQRLREIAEHLVQRSTQGILTKDFEPPLGLNHKAATDVLLGCWKDAKTLDQNTRIAMEEDPREQKWYTEIL